MLPWKLRKRRILPVSQNLSPLYFSLAKFQLVSCNLSLAIIWQMTYTQKLPKLCSATLIESLSITGQKFSKWQRPFTKRKLAALISSVVPGPQRIQRSVSFPNVISQTHLTSQSWRVLTSWNTTRGPE